MNVGKTEVMRISGQPSPVQTVIDQTVQTVIDQTVQTVIDQTVQTVIDQTWRIWNTSAVWVA